MLGIMTILGVSWALLYLLEKRSLEAIGLIPKKERVWQFLQGITVSGLLCVTYVVLDALVRSSGWQFNSEVGPYLIGQAVWWDIRSVVTEELIFRGAILFLLICYLGTRSAMLISAVAFGCYHWFSLGIIGNAVPMLVVFTGTGIMGYAWALAFAKTRSIMLPFGLHLGWNLVHNTIFSKGPLGEQVLIQTEKLAIPDWQYSLLSLYAMVIIPILELIFVTFMVSGDNLTEQKKADL